MQRVFVLVISTNQDGAVRRLRRALKTMLRRDQLRCVSVEERPQGEDRCRSVLRQLRNQRRKTMSTDEMKTSTALTPVGDGFDGYSDRVEGDEGAQHQGLIRGSLLKFSNTAEWERRDGETIESNVKLIVTDVIRAVVRWGTGKGPPEETTVIPAGQPFPDVAAMNEAIPKDQWRQGPAGPQGPFQVQQAVVLIEPRSMETFTFPTSTVGGFIAVRELVDKVKTMRKYRGPVSPIVTLGDVPMRTRFGERRRPHFTIVDWVRMGGGEPEQPALPAPIVEAKANPEPAAKPATPINTLDVAAPLPSVAPLTVGEEMNDAIPW
jgi:hypothetical protein